MWEAAKRSVFPGLGHKGLRAPSRFFDRHLLRNLLCSWAYQPG
jgi:hypothetical protein